MSTLQMEGGNRPNSSDLDTNIQVITQQVLEWVNGLEAWVSEPDLQSTNGWRRYPFSAISCHFFGSKPEARVWKAVVSNARGDEIRVEFNRLSRYICLSGV